MNNVTFYHCGDIHFDVPFTTLTGKLGLAKKRRQDIKNTFIKMIDMAVDDKPDFLFIAGDLFEQEYVTLKTMTFINDQFNKILNTKVILIAGNHDSETINSFYHTMDWNENVFFIGEQLEKIYFEQQDTIIYGIGFSIGKGQREKLHNIQCETNMSNILLFHGDVDLEIGNRDYNAVSSELLESIGFDYIAVSHNHKYRNDFGQNKVIHNAGSLEALGFDEVGEHGFIKGSIQNKKLKTFFVSLGESKYRNVEINITGITDETILINEIKNHLHNENELYRIVLSGQKDVDINIDLHKITKALATDVLFIRIKDLTKVKKQSNENITGLKGVFIKKVKEAMENEEEETIAILNKSLIYGLQAIDNEEIELSIEEEL